MRVWRRRQKARDGSQHVAPTWHLQYSAEGVQRRVAGFTDRRATEALGRHLEELAACRAAGISPPRALARFLDGLPARVLRHLHSVGLLDAAQVAGAQPLETLLGEWAEHLYQKGDTPKHCAQRVSRARSLLDAAGARFWPDIAPARVEAVLATWRDVEGLGVSTCNAYRAAAKQFCRWLCRAGRAPSNPLEHLSGQNAEPHRRVSRRALTPAECGRLLAAAPPARVLLYRVALETGLRRNELRTLCARHLDLEGSPPTLTVEAAYAKAGRRDVLPLRPQTAALLREHCRDKMPAASVFTLSDWNRTARTMRLDLSAAGIPYRDASGRQVDFHALRHTFITHLARAGVHPRTAQALARHSTLELTMGVYTHVALDSKAEAIERLPDLAPIPAETQART